MNIDISSLLSKLVAKLQAWLEALVVMLPNLVGALVVVLVFVALARWADKLAVRLVGRVSSNDAIAGLLGKITDVLTRVVGIFAALTMVNLDKTVTSLLAGVGVIGLALGFAFQDIAANFMSGVFMAVKRPFSPGDLVEVAGKLARVQAVELRATIVQTLDGVWIQVPNKDVFQNPIVNYTKTESRRMDLVVGIAYGDDLEEARKVAIDAVSDLPGRDEEHDIELFFDAFGDSSINFTLRVWLLDSSQKAYLHARYEAIIAVKKAFDGAEITIPFPIRTLDFGAAVVGGESLGTTPLRVVSAAEG